MSSALIGMLFEDYFSNKPYFLLIASFLADFIFVLGDILIIYLYFKIIFRKNFEEHKKTFVDFKIFYIKLFFSVNLVTTFMLLLSPIIKSFQKILNLIDWVSFFGILNNVFAFIYQLFAEPLSFNSDIDFVVFVHTVVWINIIALFMYIIPFIKLKLKYVSFIKRRAIVNVLFLILYRISINVYFFYKY